MSERNNSNGKYPIKLAVSDFGNNFNPDECPWLVVLHRHFDIRLCDFDEADFLLYSGFGFKHAGFGKIKIFCTEENRAPDWNACDYAFTHELIESDRHLRVPCYAIRPIAYPSFMAELVDRPLLTHEDLERQRRKFCNFIYRNQVCTVRNLFFKSLSQYRQVDSAGSLYNNVGHQIKHGCDEQGRDCKILFQTDYKFSIAFENESHPGYQTEKLTDALRARTLPVYWGNPEVIREFDARSYLYYNDFESEEALISRIAEIDGDDDLLLEYLNAPILTDVSRTCLNEERLIGRFREIFEGAVMKRTPFDRFKYNLSQVCGRGMFRQLNRFGRYVRRKS